MTEARLLAGDPRLKISLAILFGVLTWKAGVPGLAAYAILLTALCWQLRATLPGQQHVLKSYGWFLLLWIGAKFGLDLWSGISMEVAAQAGLLLGVRLTCLLLIGLALALSTSARSLGMALAWFLRPVLGRNAWQASLALALMVHFLPITWLTLSEVRRSVLRRCSHLGFFRRMLLIGQASLRGLGQKTWNQTLAVACRRLDRAEAWQPKFHASVREWAVGLCLALCACLGAVL